MNHVLSVRRGIVVFTVLLVFVILSALTGLPTWVTDLLVGAVIGVTAGIAYMLIQAMLVDLRDTDHVVHPEAYVITSDPRIRQRNLENNIRRTRYPSIQKP